MKVDLHCHSTASDGVLTPAALVSRACEMGVQLLALTDHDTLDGLAEARQSAAGQDIRIVSGIELSCTWGGATIHVLGYDFDESSGPLQQAIASVHQGRWQRAEEISRRLAKEGIRDALEGARQVQLSHGSSDNAPARPHFAEYLVQSGAAKDYSEAFRKWLGAGKMGDVKQHWPEMDQVIGTLLQASAWVSLAHPRQYDFTRSKRRRLVADFVAAGGHALEVSNGMQPADQVGSLAILAREFDLLASAGSDFHVPRNWSELGMYRAPPGDLDMLWQRFGLVKHSDQGITS